VKSLFVGTARSERYLSNGSGRLEKKRYDPFLGLSLLITQALQLVQHVRAQVHRTSDRALQQVENWVCGFYPLSHRGRDERGYSHAPPTRLCHPGRASGLNISASAAISRIDGVVKLSILLLRGTWWKALVAVRSPIYSTIDRRTGHLIGRNRSRPENGPHPVHQLDQRTTLVV